MKTNTASGQNCRVASSSVQRADGVDAEIGVRVARGPVVRRLRGGVDHEVDIGAVLRETALDGGSVADIDIVVACTGGQSATSASRFHVVDASAPKNWRRMSLSMPTTRWPRSQ